MECQEEQNELVRKLLFAFDKVCKSVIAAQDTEANDLRLGRLASTMKCFQTINAKVYVLTNEKTKTSNSPEKNPDVIIQLDNGRLYVANISKHAINEFSWEVLSHSVYSHLASSDYNLHASFYNSLRVCFLQQKSGGLGSDHNSKSKNPECRNPEI